ncbi:Uncharacterized protein Adt_06309 [Abeliophyllum distichum]|uniref:Uncharacterized protein n=1 Tax=Abeliophyllum distichum TaxID=126358 RepID=A0ABD1V7V7_9LAMI
MATFLHIVIIAARSGIYLASIEVKLEEVYWQDLNSYVEEEDIVSQESKGYETEHDAEPSHSFYRHSPRVFQPPPVCHDHYIVDVVRMEMGKLEGRFHSTTSACDSNICNTTNIPEAQLEMGRKKNAGIDDVINKPKKERILEEEVGKELVAGKQAGEDGNIIDETDYVEKRMSADFFTMKKFEEDANKSIEDM